MLLPGLWRYGYKKFYSPYYEAGEYFAKWGIVIHHEYSSGGGPFEIGFGDTFREACMNVLKKIWATERYWKNARK